MAKTAPKPAPAEQPAAEWVSLTSLHPWDRNPRRNDGAVAKVAASIKRFGFGAPIVARRADGRIIAGHTRFKAAQSLGITTVPVRYLDLDPSDADLLALADNRTGEEAEWDNPLLAEILRELSVEDRTETGFDESEIDAILAEAEATVLAGVEEDQDAVEEPPAEPRSKPGEVYELGPHRLMCGDCRDFGAVSKLIGTTPIVVAVTSPPYASQRTYDQTTAFKPIPPEAYVEWFQDVQANVRAVLAPDGSWFVNIKEHCEDGQRSLYVKDLTIAHVRQWGWRFVDEICWRNTRNGVPGEWPNRFKNAWEPVFHFATQAQIRFHPERVGHESDGVFEYSADNAKTQSGSGLLGEKATGYRAGVARPSNVIEAAAESGQGEHSAPYPVAIPEFLIRAFSDPRDAVFDPFMGSGTTLIAAAKHGRVCFGMEISPGYCDVIRNRWERFIAKKKP